jgi:hypothetical protein
LNSSTIYQPNNDLPSKLEELSSLIGDRFVGLGKFITNRLSTDNCYPSQLSNQLSRKQSQIEDEIPEDLKDEGNNEERLSTRIWISENRQVPDSLTQSFDRLLRNDSQQFLDEGISGEGTAL